MTDSDLGWLNSLLPPVAHQQFLRCCGAEAWCRGMVEGRPFASLDRLHHIADVVMDGLSERDWLEAFASHPPIGDLESLRMKYSGNREWSANEQAAIDLADERVLLELSQANASYLEKFGFLFIVCATGKTAVEMLGILRQRLAGGRADELVQAAVEQRKITHLRLDKLRMETR